MQSNGMQEGHTSAANVTSELLDKLPLEEAEIVIEDDQDYRQIVTYKVEDVPPAAIILSVALQNVLMSLGGALTTAYVIGDVICAPSDHPIRARLFCTTLIMSGICTTLQPLIGIRLPVFQGVCSTFLIPLLAMRNSEDWKCQSVSDTLANDTGANVTLLSDRDEAIYRRLQEMMGCLIFSSLFEVIIGITGLIGFLLRYIGPLTIAPVVSLIGLSLYRIPMEYARVHWGLSALCIVVCVILMLYLDRVEVPFPVGCRRRKGSKPFKKVPLFQMFPILISIMVTWLVCGILTATNTLSNDPAALEYRARTDVRQNIIRETPWFYLPHPGQFGSPRFNLTIFVGFLAAVISSVLESIGDYFATAHVTQAPPPPTHAVNRGILLEGLGSVLSGAMGAGHATTSSTGHIAILGISKVASRYCMVASGVVCIVLSVVGKIGAILSTMPDPPVGGAMFITFGILSSIGIFTLRSVDLSSSRNLAVFGLSLYAGIVVPSWFDWYPEAVESGNETLDGVVKGLFGTPMFLGGIVAIFLDNTVRGTRKERGFRVNDDEENTSDINYVTSEEDAYEISAVAFLLKHIPFLEKLPFIQPNRNKLCSK